MMELIAYELSFGVLLDQLVDLNPIKIFSTDEISAHTELVFSLVMLNFHTF